MNGLTGEPRLVWGLYDGRHQIVLVTVRFPSGALGAWLVSGEGANGIAVNSRLVSSGSFDDRLFAFVRGRGYLVVGPPQAVRAEVRLPNGQVQRFPLVGGGGLVEVPNVRKAPLDASIRVFDASGRLLDERGPEAGGVNAPF